MKFGTGLKDMKTREKNLMKASSRKEGFTLLEMMVVVGIIGILITLAIPASRSAVRSAKEATCVKGLHVIYSAVRMYEVEFGYSPVQTSQPSSLFMIEIDPFLPESIDRVHNENVMIKGYRLFGWVPESSSNPNQPVFGGPDPVPVDRLGSRNWRIIAVPIEPFSQLSTFYIGPDGHVSRELDGKPV